MLVLALLCVPKAAGAANDKPLSATAMAEALFKEGKKLLKEGKVAEACRKLEGSYRIDPAPGTLLNLALCHEEEGRTATAWGELNESMQLAKKANRPDRLKIAQDHIREIEPKLSRFVVAVPAEATVKDMVVEVDGVPLDPGAWGTAIPIDPGEHMAVAKAPKYQNWETKFTVDAAKTATVLVPKPVREPDPAPPSDRNGPWRRPAGYAALGLSAVLVGVGGYFGVRAISAGTEVAASCPQQVCPAAAWQTLEGGRTAATVSNVLLSVGAAAAGAGVFFLLTAPKPAEDEATPEAARGKTFVTVGLGPSGGSLGVGGAF